MTHELQDHECRPCGTIFSRHHRPERRAHRASPGLYGRPAMSPHRRARIHARSYAGCPSREIPEPCGPGCEMLRGEATE